MTDQTPQEMQIDPPKKRRISTVWIVPIVALAISLFIAWQSLSQRGPVIEIEFSNGEGVVAGETELKFRDVKVGEVEKVRFTPDLSKVIVSVRLDNTIADYVDSDAQFWIVRPQISAQGISGLTTLLGGVYLEGVWDDGKGSRKSTFIGLSAPPLIKGTEEGTEFVLSAPRGGRVQAGAPIIFKGVTVGFIDEPELTEDGEAITARAFVKAPHDNLLTTRTRFWGAGGFSVELGLNGFKLDVANLASLIQGGVRFADFGPGGVEIQDNHVYNVYEDEESARNAAYISPDAEDYPLVATFSGSLSGLQPNAAVQFDGIRIGTVTNVGTILDTEDGVQMVRLRANMSIEPERIGMAADSTPEEVANLLTGLVEQGYRARLATSGLLGGTLKIEIVDVPDAPAAEMTTDSDGVLEFPTTEPDAEDIAEAAKSAMQRLDDLPLEALVQSAADILANANRIIESPQLQETPSRIVELLDEARSLVASEALQELPDEINSTVSSIRSIVDTFQQSEAVSSLIAALDRADKIAQSVETTADGLPSLVKQIDDLAAKANALPLDELVTSTTEIVDNADTWILSEGIQGLPDQLSASMNELSATLENARQISQEIAQSGVVENLVATLQRADTVAASLETSAQKLPDLLTSIQSVATNVEALPLSQLITDATDLVQSSEAFISSDGVQQLPPELAQSMASINVILDNVETATDEVTESQAIQSLTDALTRSAAIAQSVETSAQKVPQILDEIQSLSAKADELPLETLVDNANSVVESANSILSSSTTAALPEELSDVLNTLEGTLTEVYSITDRLAQGQAVDSLVAALSRADEIATSIQNASDGLPKLVADITQVAQTAKDLPLDTLVNSSDALLESANRLVSSPDTAKIPGALAAALDEVNLTLEELREGGAVQNTNEALESAKKAAASIEAAAASLPQLSAEIEDLIARSELLIASYGSRSEFNAQTLMLLRDLRNSAQAVTSLARTIERKPNSLIVGR